MLPSLRTPSKCILDYTFFNHIFTQVPNELFYDNELRACADEVLRNSLCNWDGLKRPGFPVIFEAVFGKDQREESSPSFFNAEEVSVVLRYVRELKDARGIPLQMSEIGIISPYHRQASCVADAPYFFWQI